MSMPLKMLFKYASIFPDITLIELLFLINFLCFNLNFASRNLKQNKTQNYILAIKRLSGNKIQDFLKLQFWVSYRISNSFILQMEKLSPRLGKRRAPVNSYSSFHPTRGADGKKETSSLNWTQGSSLLNNTKLKGNQEKWCTSKSLSVDPISVAIIPSPEQITPCLIKWGSGWERRGGMSAHARLHKHNSKLSLIKWN